jgi:putative PIN family toxin of toxin-antitoxin system
MRITVDTNILVSATFWTGASDKIIEKVEKKEIELVLSKEIMEEYVRVLNYKDIQDKIKDKNLEMNRTVEKITVISKFVAPTQKFKVVKDDETDDKFIDCAVEGKVDYLVSNDKHLLKIKEFQGIKIITPEEFLKIA